MKKLILILSLLLSLPGISQLSWTVSNTGLPSSDMSFNDFAVAPGGQVFLVGSSQTWNSYEARLFWSNSNGSTWAGVNINTCDVILPRSILFVGNKMLMCGQNSSGKSYVYASTDYGINWSLSSAGMASYYTSLDELVLGPNGHIYAAGTKTIPPYGATNAVILESGDGGVGWSELTSTGITNTSGVFSLFFDKNGKMYLSGGSSILPNRLYTSTDLGYTWTMSNSGIPLTYYVKDFITSNGSDVYACCTYDDGSSVVEPRMMKTTNSGASWINAGTLTGLTNEIGTIAMLNLNGTVLMSGFGYSSTYFVHKSTLPVAKPLVTTSPVSGVTQNKAVAGGTLTQTGGDPNVTRGLCWSTSPGATLNDQKMTEGTGAGPFSATITNLAPQTAYYIRAYGTNSAGTTYGAEITFTTLTSTVTTNGISENEIATGFDIFPVPASELIFIRETNAASNSLYSIIDVLGKTVLTARPQKEKNSIDISKLPNGVYFLQAENGIRRRFVKE